MPGILKTPEHPFIRSQAKMEKRKIKVLIADDEAHIRSLLNMIVTSLGAEVVAEASNGQMAFKP